MIETSSKSTTIPNAQSGNDLKTITSNLNNLSINSNNNASQIKEEWSLDLTRVTLILQFLEYLEKNIYSAYEGTAVCMQAPLAKVIY